MVLPKIGDSNTNGSNVSAGKYECTCRSAFRFDVNNDLKFGQYSDGCEVGCPNSVGGTCTKCSDANTCTSVKCDAKLLPLAVRSLARPLLAVHVSIVRL
eukprot:COSAG01_NODE_2383_length_7791_cov_2.022751_1_plen_99_part_00